MRDIISNLIKIFHFFTKIHLVLISIIIILIIKCEPLEINSMENNDAPEKKRDRVYKISSHVVNEHIFTNLYEKEIEEEDSEDKFS